MLLATIIITIITIMISLRLGKSIVNEYKVFVLLGCSALFTVVLYRV